MSSSRPDVDVRLVRTSEDVADFIEWLEARLTTVLAIDTETTGLEWWTPSFCRLWQIGDDKAGWAIPVEWWGKVIDHAMGLIVKHRTPIVMHNAKFDMHAIEVSGWPLPHWDQVLDTAILMHLHRSDKSRALKGRGASDLLGPWIYAGKDELNRVAKQKYGLSPSDKWQYIPVDEPAFWAYGVMDTVQTRMIYDALVALNVPQDFAPQLQREMHYMSIMYRAEKRGVLVDERYTRELQSTLHHRIDQDLFYLRSKGLDNPNSVDQVVDLLETDYGFVPWEFTPTGKASLNKNVLAVLSQAGGLQMETVEALVRYKRNVKWKGTYVDRFLTSADIHGFAHPSINTMAARTGRSSIQGPPLQTLPSGDPMIRRCLLPPKKHSWYSLDVSNQEPRLLAHYGRSPELLRYFTEGDAHGSIHDFVAGEMFGQGYTKEQRSIAKVFGLARSYGAQEETLAVSSGLSVGEVLRILPRYDEIMGLDRYGAQVDRMLAEREEPFIVTVGGRRVHLDPEKILTTKVNFAMQGSGADQLKDAGIALDRAGLSDYIIVPVHDELCFGFPKEEADGMAREAQKIMESACEALAPSVTFPVDIEGPASSWGGLYD